MPTRPGLSYTSSSSEFVDDITVLGPLAAFGRQPPLRPRSAYNVDGPLYILLHEIFPLIREAPLCVSLSRFLEVEISNVKAFTAPYWL